MENEKLLNLIIANQDEIKSDLKEVVSEIQDINGRVTELETHHFWKVVHIGWVSKSILLGAGIFIGFFIEHFIKL